MATPEWLLWDHNTHYRAYLLRHIPASFDRALDVGCGAGDLARLLGARAAAVDAVDLSPVMIAAARAASPEQTNINWIEGDVLDLDWGAEGYDVVTASASLHHMPLDRALQRLGGLVRPNGVLAILGLYRAATVADYGVCAVAAGANPVVGMWKAVRGERAARHAVMPLAAPATTLAQIRMAAARHLPGAIVHRHLFYRYSLVWMRRGS